MFIFCSYHDFFRQFCIMGSIRVHFMKLSYWNAKAPIITTMLVAFLFTIIILFVMEHIERVQTNESKKWEKSEKDKYTRRKCITILFLINKNGHSFVHSLRSHRKKPKAVIYLCMYVHFFRVKFIANWEKRSFDFVWVWTRDRVWVCMCVYLPVSCNLFAFYLGSTIQRA